jgi:hypothetical protein
VSRFVFARYRPWIAVDRYLLLLRRGVRAPDLGPLIPRLRSPVATQGLHFAVHPCDWGAAADFLPRREGGETLDLPIRRRREEGDARVLELEVPPQARAEGHPLLEVTLSGPAPAAFSLSDADPPADDRREIRFRTARGAPRPLEVPVGSCLQWHGYEASTLYLRQQGGAPVRRVRLVR